MQLPPTNLVTLFSRFLLFIPCPHNILAFLADGIVSIISVCISHSMPFSQKTQNLLSPTKWQKYFFEKIFQVALKKKRKNFQSLQGVEALCEKKEKFKIPQRG